MKKIAILLVAVLTAGIFAGCSAGDTDEGSGGKKNVTLNVYNWGEYIDDEDFNVNEKFTEETGIKVNYKTFENNESMYTIISSGAADYDVLFPSDYMVGKLINENLLAKLDFANIPNYQYIDEAYKNLDYDPNNEYSVPYTWGTVGIFYNKKHVDEKDLAQGWDILWNEKYKDKIYMFDNPRDAFGIALIKLGYKVNTTNKAEWEAAYNELLRQKPLVQGYFNDQIFTKMPNEEGWLAPYYSGDGSIMMYGEDGNENIGYFVPEQGTNFFVDAMCVTKDTKHKAEAEAYINFLCRTDVAKANAEYLGYSTPQTEARKQLDPTIGENPVFYPPASIMEKTQVFLTLPAETNKLMDDLWIKLKSK